MIAGSARPAGLHRLVAFDLETTGLSPRSDRIIEIGAVGYDAALHRVDELEIAVDPGMPIPLVIQRLVGLTDADVRGAPDPAEGVAQLAEFCSGAALIAHAGAFDLLFLRGLLPDAFGDRLVFDTLELARILLPVAESHSLPNLTARIGLEHLRPHRALSDASATGALFRTLVGVARGLPAPALEEMRRVAGQARGPLQTFLDDVIEGPADAPASEGMPLASPVPHSRPLDMTAEVASARDRLPLGDAAAVLLGPRGPLAGREGYEYREAQLEMARAVGQTLERRGRLLVEAGTGIGKSLAYLAPLALWASRTGARAVVATHTINLQEQLADRDLPLANSLLAEPLPVAVLKGRNHYLSLRRWRRFLTTPDAASREPDMDAIRFKLKVIAWLAQSSTGDRSEIHLGGAEEPHWARVASDAGDCLGAACANWAPARCFMVAARRTAADAAIIVTNHALLLAGAERQGQVLGEHGALVVDEAHRLEEAATEQMGVRIRFVDLTLLLDRLPAAGGGALSIELERCREAGQRLFGDVKGFLTAHLGGERAGNGRVGLSDAIRHDAAFVTVVRAAAHAAGVLQHAATLIETGGRDVQLQESLLPQPSRAEDELAHGAAALSALAGAVDRVLCHPRDGHVAWLEMRAEQAEIHEAPVDVAGALGETVFDRADSVVLTSATLSVGGRFEFMRERTGIGIAAEELRLPSPFDYLRQALCILPENVTAYDDPVHDVQMAALIDEVVARIGGHLLVLFTSYGPLKRVYAQIQDRLEQRGIGLLGQGIDGTRRQILQSFLADPRSVLLGTSSFWEGVDIPGERLRCVVIDKLPFPVPTDPLVRARSERLVDPFGQYILPQAVIRLRQGFGRLIRGSSDRGAVVLCDPRLRTREYGPGFLAALPPARVLHTTLEGVALAVEEFVATGNVSGSVGESRSWSSSNLDPA